MAINIATKAILKILSFGGIDVEVSRQLADLKRLDPMKIFYKKMDLQDLPTQVSIHLFPAW